MIQANILIIGGGPAGVVANILALAMRLGYG
jgi:thioredoxin reductase